MLNTDLVKSVLSATTRTQARANTETDLTRRAFHLKTTSPIIIDSHSINSDMLSEKLCSLYIVYILNFAAGSEGFKVVVDQDSKNCQMAKFNIDFTFTYFLYKNSRHLIFTHDVQYQSTRYEKISSAVNKIKEEILDSFSRYCTALGLSDRECVDEYNDIRDGLCRQDKLIKTYNNISCSDTIWLYFTDCRIEDHYVQLATAQSLTSCMSKTIANYGVSIGGTEVHPLAGYNHSPDFKLCLASNKSPEELEALVATAEQTGVDMPYPFTARAIVFPFKDENETVHIAYARFYGNEIVQQKVEHVLKHRETPQGCVLHAVLIDDVERTQYNRSTLVDDVKDLLDDKQIDGYLLCVPYVDCYSNNCIIVSDKTKTTQDGLRVIEIVNAGKNDCTYQGMRTYGSHYGSGLLAIGNSTVIAARTKGNTFTITSYDI